MKKEPKKEKNNKKKMLVVLLTILLIALIALTALLIIYSDTKNKENLPYTTLLDYLEEDKVEKMEMTYGSTTLKVTLKEREKEEDTETVIVPSIQAFMEHVQNRKMEGKDINLEPKPASIVTTIASKAWSIIPTILMIALFVMIFQMQGLGDKGVVYDGEENKSNVKFEDIAGLEEEKN